MWFYRNENKRKPFSLTTLSKSLKNRLSGNNKPIYVWNIFWGIYFLCGVKKIPFLFTNRRTEMTDSRPRTVFERSK